MNASTPSLYSANRVVRGEIVYFVDDPADRGEDAMVHHEDGILWVENGRIKACDSADKLIDQLPADIEVEHFTHHLIVPGFIDTHIHYPQTEVVAAYGTRLLEWLETYTFPAEGKFKDKEHGKVIADQFLDELLGNGTTTALIFGTVHPQSVDAFFERAQARGVRMIAGKVMMDRNAPEYLTDEAESSYNESRDLIERWHGVDRLQYAVTPRFAPTSTREQLDYAGRLLKEYPSVYLHTHLSENVEECAWVQELFPESKHYLDVYDRAGLLGRRSVFAHGIHLCDDECSRLSSTHSSISHCPTSNTFLGSGLIQLAELHEKGVEVGLGTDIGGGTTFSMLKVMAEAYKVQQMRQQKLDPLRAFYLATLGGARALDLEGTVGSLAPGNEADFVALDLHSTDLIKFRIEHCKTLFEKLFVLTILGDDRAIDTTWSLGEVVHKRN